MEDSDKTLFRVGIRDGMRWSEPLFRVRLIHYDMKKMIESKQKKEEWKWT